MDECELCSQACLAKCHLSNDLLHRTGLLIEYHQLEKLMLAVVEGFEQADIGMNNGKKPSINSHGTLGFTLLNCVLLRQDIELFQRHIRIVTF